MSTIKGKSTVDSVPKLITDYFLVRFIRDETFKRFSLCFRVFTFRLVYAVLENHEHPLKKCSVQMAQIAFM